MLAYNQNQNYCLNSFSTRTDYYDYQLNMARWTVGDESLDLNYGVATGNFPRF